MYWFFFVFETLCLAVQSPLMYCSPSRCVLKQPSSSLLGYIFQGSSTSDVLRSSVRPSVLQVIVISVCGSPANPEA